MSEKDEKQNAGEIAVDNPFLKWCENIWYHYKWRILLGLFALLVVIVCVTQCSEKENTDGIFCYAGSYVMQKEEESAIRAAFSGLLSSDRNGDGSKSLTLSRYNIASEEELKELWRDEDGKLSAAYENARLTNSNDITALTTFMQTGECCVYLVSPYVYDSRIGEQVLMPLSDLFETDNVTGAYDAYAVTLSETAFYRYYDALKVLPDDTLLILTRQTYLGDISDDETYQYYKDLFCAVVNFSAP